MTKAPARPPIYGLMAEFEGPTEVVEAARSIHEAGYKKVDAYSPYPMEELSEALDFHHSPLPKLVLAGGIVGLIGGYGLQYWTSVIDYPINIGGRPLHSWPAFIPPAFETTILGAALFVGTIGLFLTLFLLFIRFLPMISIFEMRTLVAEEQQREEHA